MGKKGRAGGAVRMLRRSIGLGLAIVGVWCAGLTADPAGLWGRLEGLGGGALAGQMLSAQLGALPGERHTAGLDGWGRLLLDQSAFLSGAQERLELWRMDQEEQEERQDKPPVQQPSTQTPLPPADDGVVEMTAVGKEGGQYLSRDGVYLYDRTGQGQQESLFDQGSVDFTLGEGPQILIVHTHGSEAYTPSDGQVYQESDPYRTTDNNYNMVRVGEEMAQVFREAGFEVVHDETLHDYPSYNGAYDRSKEAVSRWLEQYPTIRVVLDVHRDALEGSEGEVYKLVTREEEGKMAQVMLVVGTDASGLEHPGWKNNLAFARMLQRQMLEDYQTLARPIVLRSSRYNQQLSPGSLLVEVGGHGNTLTEALAAARAFAQEASQVFQSLKGK